MGKGERKPFVRGKFRYVWTGKKYEPEHRVVAAQKMGRTLVRSEHVAHKNGDTLDNRPSNIFVYTGSAPDSWAKIKCFTCGKEIHRRVNLIDRNRHHFCSQACYHKARKNGVYNKR